MNAPLEGTTVVSLEQAVAAPFATRQLADLGARVIKVERPGAGDFARKYNKVVKGLSDHFVWLNRSKESLTLDLKQREARGVLEKLIARADVFVQNLAPSATDRLGLSAETLRERHARLVVCGISGYGSSGPYRDKKAYDLLVQAEVGLISINGVPETPSKVAISVADISAGMYAYSGILTALLARERTGRGSAFEVSLFESLGEWMGFPMYRAAYGEAPPRSGADHATIAPYGPFETEDGAVYLSIQNDREWVRFCEQVLERPGLASEPRFASIPDRTANKEPLRNEIEETFGKLSRRVVTERLEEAKIANAQMRTVEEFIDHPQLKARERWRNVGTPEGPIPALLPPVTVEGTESVMRPVPELGEHTESIMLELGYAEEDVSSLRRAGAI